MARAKQSFEAMMEELEARVSRLEKGDLALSEAINEYSAGMKLAAACRKQLTEAEQKMEKNTEKDTENNGEEQE